MDNELTRAEKLFPIRSTQNNIIVGHAIAITCVVFWLIWLGTATGCVGGVAGRQPLPSNKDNHMANTLPGLYDYQGFDSGGNQIAAGEISIEIDQEQHVRGTWHLNSVGKNQSHLIEQIGPQFGNGILSGSLADRNLELDLHRTIDNSVVLHGKVGNGMITGHWEYLTDAGVSGTGTFKATRK